MNEEQTDNNELWMLDVDYSEKHNQESIITVLSMLTWL